MTILGCVLDGPGRALFWADSEQYGADGDMSLAAKLHINTTASCIGAGAGTAAIIRYADRALNDATDFDDVPASIAKVLRAEASRRAEDLQRARRESFACQTFLAVGFAPSAGRLLAWELTGASFFVPTLVSRAAWPPVPEADAVRFLDCAAVIRIATAQMRIVQGHYPHATGGPLCVAEMVDGQIRVVKLDRWFNSIERERAA